VVRAASSTLQFPAEPGILDEAPGARQIAVADQYPPGQETYRTFERAHVFVGDEDVDAVLGKERADCRDHYDIVGAQEFDHRAVLAPIRKICGSDALM
jgi:hypothetical protein